jgi:hypothetical protein
MKVTFLDSGCEPKCPPDPRYPDGIDADISDGVVATCDDAHRMRRVRLSRWHYGRREARRPAHGQDDMPAAGATMRTALIMIACLALGYVLGMPPPDAMDKLNEARRVTVDYGYGCAVRGQLLSECHRVLDEKMGWAK